MLGPFFFLRSLLFQIVEGAEKVALIVIPSEARNLLFAKSQEKADSSDNPALGMTRPRVFQHPAKS